MLLDRQNHLNIHITLNPNTYNSKSWITTGIAKSIKVKDNLYNITFHVKQIYKKQNIKTNLGPIRTIFPLSLDAQRTHITKDVSEITKEISRQSGKQLRNLNYYHTEK